MNIILNHTLRSIKNNRTQIALIVTTIAIVTLMIFVALSMTGLFYNINAASQSRLAGDTDIVLKGELFAMAKIEDYVTDNRKSIEYADCFLQSAALVKTADTTKIVMLEAADLPSLNERYPEKLVTHSVAENSIEYPSVWIGEDFAAELGIKAGDSIELFFEGWGKFEKMTVSRVLQNLGFFADSSVNNVFIDFSAINHRGVINLAYLKLADGANYDDVAAELQAHMKNDAIVLDTAIDTQRLGEIVESNTQLLNIALAFIMTIMVLILFTSYLVIARNRLNEMIIFKAAGASPAQTLFIMMSEVILYGVAGAAIGVALGRVGMAIVSKALIPSFPGAIKYDIWKYFAAFFVGVGVSAVSAIFPILRISKKSIRELTSGIVKDVKYTRPVIIIALSLLLAASVSLLFLLEEWVVPLTVTVIALFAVWVYFVVPYAVRAFSRIFSVFSKESRLASFSIKRNASTNVLTVLVGAAVTFSFIVVSVISLVITAITPYNSRFSADYVVSSAEERNFEELTNKLFTVEGVNDVVYYKTADYAIPGQNRSPLRYKVIGISAASALSYATSGVSDERIKKFATTPHAMVMSHDLATRFGLKVGDTFRPSRQRSTASVTYEEKLDYDFEIVALDYTNTENDRVIYVNIGDMTYNQQEIATESSMVFIKAASTKQDMFFALRDKISDEPGLFVLNFNDWAYATSKGLEGVSALLKFLQILVSLVAFIGVINLTIVTLNDRKKEFTVYKASGLSSSKFLLLTLYESAIIALSGGVIGTCLSLIFNRIMPVFAALINKYLIYQIFPASIFVIAAIAFGVYVSVYLLVALSNKKAFRKLSFQNERAL
jgi:putative ABC transport system permease protein